MLTRTRALDFAEGVLTADLEKRIKTLAEWMLGARHLVVFTGAGISTESGLADFRGPDGLWTRQAKGLPAKSIDFASAEPNAGHLAIAELQRLGKLTFLISQNVDNLHLRSGIRPELIAELHGNITKLRCQSCEFLMDNFGDQIPCPICGGQMASSVVNFGQSLPQHDLEDAYAAFEDSGPLPGCRLHSDSDAGGRYAPRRPPGRGAPGYHQPGRNTAGQRGPPAFDEKIGDVLPPAVARLKEMMQTP